MGDGGGLLLYCCHHLNQEVTQEGGYGETGKQKGAKDLGHVGRIWMDMDRGGTAGGGGRRKSLVWGLAWVTGWSR